MCQVLCFDRYAMSVYVAVWLCGEYLAALDCPQVGFATQRRDNLRVCTLHATMEQAEEALYCTWPFLLSCCSPDRSLLRNNP